MCQENYHFHSCQHLTYHGIHPCDRYKAVQQLCVTLTTTPRITSLSTPIYREPLQRVLIAAADTTSSSTTTCSNPSHVSVNPHPRSIHPDLPDDFEIPPLPSRKAKYSKPKMTKRTVAVNYDCKECRLERMRPECKGLTVEEEMVVQPLMEIALRHQLRMSWHTGFAVWWNDPNTVREREMRAGAARSAEILILDENGEDAMQVDFERREVGEHGGADTAQDKGKAVTRNNGDTPVAQAYVSIFGGN